MTDECYNTILKEKLDAFKHEKDPVKEMVKWLLKELMEVEIDGLTGAEKGKHDSERENFRCGYRDRKFDTRVGTLNLKVPRVRNGGYVPFFVTSKKRSEQALMQVIQEAWVNGVSTRKIDKLAKSLGIDNISSAQVSNINKGLDKLVSEFRTRALEKEYAVIWVDALYEKIRNDHRVQNMAVMVVKGVNLEGKREILAVEPMENESEETYKIIFDKLKQRGVEKVWLCISDAHKGLKAAITKCWQGSSWQRCKVHFMRNILAHVNTKNKNEVAGKLKLIWQAPDVQTSIKIMNDFVGQYQNKFPQAIKCLEEGFEDSIQFYAFEDLDVAKISSSNPIERVNREIRRRSTVVGIFPSPQSYIRLITTYLIECTEDWQTDKYYISSNTLMRQRDKLMRNLDE